MAGGSTKSTGSGASEDSAGSGPGGAVRWGPMRVAAVSNQSSTLPSPASAPGVSGRVPAGPV
ncbi:hypothetical protein GCM10025734_24800 [Kitasatospora paranensis]